MVNSSLISFSTHGPSRKKSGPDGIFLVSQGLIWDSHIFLLFPCGSVPMSTLTQDNLAFHTALEAQAFLLFCKAVAARSSRGLT
jgi:hypothetical protein